MFLLLCSSTENCCMYLLQIHVVEQVCVPGIRFSSTIFALLPLHDASLAPMSAR
uniref:Uncharacterized protein n=1 Tax=Triticum urartu TaxID=4572 RepID=A0A8R7PLP8_TRIUA